MRWSKIDSFTGVRAKGNRLTCDLRKILELFSAALFVHSPRCGSVERGAVAHCLQRDQRRHVVAVGSAGRRLLQARRA